MRTNLYGAERLSAIAVIDDDDAFDRWMEEFERKTQLEAAASATGGKKGGGMTKEQFIEKYDRIFDPTKG